MNDVLSMRVVERRCYPSHELKSFVERNLPVTQQTITQRLSFHDRHDIIEETACFSRIEKRNDVRVIQSRGELYLAEKTVGADRAAQVRMQHLQCNLPGGVGRRYACLHRYGRGARLR